MHFPRSLDAVARWVVGAFYAVCGFVFLAILVALFKSISWPDLYVVRETWFKDDVLRNSLWITLQLAFLAFVFQLGLAFIATLLTNEVSGLTKALLIAPYAVGVTTSAFPIYIFFSSAFGPFETNILGSEIGARLIIVALDTWQWSGILLLACFVKMETKAESSSRGFEQARLEGIGKLRAWWLIRWPVIGDVVLLYIAFRCLDWFRKADAVHLMYGQGGPGYTVQTFPLHIEELYFSSLTYKQYSVFLILAQIIIGGYFLSAVIRSKAAQKITDEN